MGGEKETVLSKKDGGTAELNNIRLHENNGEVHFHDDRNKLKCAVPVSAWWKGWESIRTSCGTWQYIDIVNNTQVTAKTFMDLGGLDVSVHVDKMTVSGDYSKLNIFSKRK